jgi:NADP-dependent alcohol dehydrogenase
MFYSYNPIKLIFGKNSLNKIKYEIKKEYKILLLSGRNVISKNPNIINNLKKQIKNKMFLFNNFSPNPELSDCFKAITFGREKSINFIISIGGGSIIDAAKFCSLFFYEPHLGWDFMTGKTKKLPKKFIDFGCIQTYPGSGSESNAAFVISNSESNQKLSSITLNSYPKFSIMDTNFTTSLKTEQTNYGILDMFSHVLEQYLTSSKNDDLQKKYCESLLIKIIENAYKIKESPRNHYLRLENFWYASQAVNGTLSRMYAKNDWSSHVIGHVLTSIYGLTHAQTLAICLPRIMKYFYKKRIVRLESLNKNIFFKFYKSKDSIKSFLKFLDFLNIGYNLENYNLNNNDVAKNLKKYFLTNNVKAGHEVGLQVNSKNIENIINIKL